MEKRRQVKVLAVVAIVIAISSMGFSFASMSTKLDIKGFATMGSADWDVHFDNLSHANLMGETIEVVRPTITNDSTTISTYDVKFQAPKDAISYNFEIINDGGMDAKITTLDIEKPSCKGSGDSSANDEFLVCNNLKYSLTYLDGTPLKVGDVLKKGTVKDAQLKLLYGGADLPTSEVRISNLGIVVIYSQN